MSFDGGEFESWLEDGLGKALNAQTGPSPLATQASYHAAYLSGGVGLSFSSSIVTALTSKLAAGAATTVLVVGGGTAVAATAATGSLNPTDWGQFISQTVVPNCKDQAASAGLHGIGQCVSSIARLHGQEVASAARHHGASDARDNRGHEEATEGRKNGAENGHGQGNGKENGENGQGNGSSGQGNGNSQGHGAPPKH